MMTTGVPSSSPAAAAFSITTPETSWPITRGYCRKRMLALVDMVVGAADADMRDTDSHPVFVGSSGFARRFSRTSRPGSTADDRLHVLFAGRLPGPYAFLFFGRERERPVKAAARLS